MGRRGSTKGDESGTRFLGFKKQLFEERKCLRDVGPVHLIMMTLDSLTPESGSQYPRPAIKKQDSRL